MWLPTRDPPKTGPVDASSKWVGGGSLEPHLRLLLPLPPSAFLPLPSPSLLQPLPQLTSCLWSWITACGRLSRRGFCVTFGKSYLCCVGLSSDPVIHTSVRKPSPPVSKLGADKHREQFSNCTWLGLSTHFSSNTVFGGLRALPVGTMQTQPSLKDGISFFLFLISNWVQTALVKVSHENRKVYLAQTSLGYVNNK